MKVKYYYRERTKFNLDRGENFPKWRDPKGIFKGGSNKDDPT
jgi:hypothetical protein